MVVNLKSYQTVAGYASTVKYSGLEHFYGSLPLKNRLFHFSDPFFQKNAHISRKCKFELV